MFQVVICTVSSGRVQRKPFHSWEDARQCADTASEKGQRIRVWIERMETPATLQREIHSTRTAPTAQTGRSMSA